MKNSLRLVAFGLGALCLHGCLELVRRPAAGEPIGYAYASAAAPTATSAATIQPAPVLVVIDRPKRSRQQLQNIEQVNKYALWCIENAMWNEAQSHMERALAQDSLSASLHNNLGVIYERLGMTDKAAQFYERARALNPTREAYAANLRHLQQYQQASLDSTDSLDIFRGDDGPRPRTRRPEYSPTSTGE
ncbi:MAG: tetratricopeptide repeat protein [Gemmatimonadetes bacterium]|nr:tetratricopeptide repeat protein [Gemmatimonadota bacterium]